MELAGRLGKSETPRAIGRRPTSSARHLRCVLQPGHRGLGRLAERDGKLHDYCFLFVNGIAIHAGLVPRDKANAIMDRLLAKMKGSRLHPLRPGAAGQFGPRCLKGQRRRQLRRWGGGTKPDGSDGFQIYENGGATACHAFHTIAALYYLGRREAADRILFPMLDAFEKRGFEGTGPTG